MSGIGRNITAAAAAISLCIVPTAAIAATPVASAAAAPVAAAPVNPWLALSAMTTSSSAVSSAAAAQGEDGDGGVPILPLAVILATIGVAVYILVKDDSSDPISPF